jgi:predicted DNA-binding transcriptional regulator YafY
MRSQRLVSCLLLLQGKHRLTARELAAQLDVSMRTVYRDVDALSQSGVPIHMERGPLGGVVLADDYRRALAQFTSDELQTLFASADGPMRDLGITAQPQALQKLAGALPASQRRVMEAGRDQLLLDHNRWGRGAQPTDILVRLRSAVAQTRRIRLRYRDREGTTTERLVDPLGLVAKAGVWYLVAHEEAKGYRTFRAERIAAVDETGERFARPADFRLEEHWSASVASIERHPEQAYHVVLRVARDTVPPLTTFWHAAIVAEDGARVTLRIPFPTRELAIIKVLHLGDEAELLEPLELAGEIAAFARSALARYAQGSLPVMAETR